MTLSNKPQTSFIDQYIDESILHDILQHYSGEEELEVRKQILAITALSVLYFTYDSIDDMHKRASFLHQVPKVLAQELPLAQATEYRPDISDLISEHVTRTLLALRSQIKTELVL